MLIHQIHFPVYLLPQMKLPFLPTGKHRAFPIRGDSMPPIKEGSFVIGKFIEKLEIESVSSGSMLYEEPVNFKLITNDDKENDIKELIYDQNKTDDGKYYYTKLDLKVFDYDKKSIEDTNNVQFTELQSLEKENKQNVNEIIKKYDEVIAVAALDEGGNLATFTSRDFTVDIVAPGTNIYSTHLNNNYCKMSGTSQASPFVAGICALIKAALKNQNLLF